MKDALEQRSPPRTRRSRRCKPASSSTLKQLQPAFDKAQVVEINPVGREVRPAPAPGDGDGRQSTQPANTVVHVFQKGYLINDRVLRPALVDRGEAKPATH